MREVHRQHQIVGDALVAFVLEVMLGEPEACRSRARPSSWRSPRSSRDARQVLVRIAALVGGGGVLPAVGKVDVPAYTVVNSVIMLRPSGSFGELPPVCPNFAFFATKRRSGKGSIEWSMLRSAAPGSGSVSPGSAAAGSAGSGSAPARARPSRRACAPSARRGSICSTPRRSTAPRRRRPGDQERAAGQVVICTKARIPRRDGRAAAERAVASLDNSLEQLGTDYIDIFQLHGVSPKAYDHALESSRRRC